ncbi:MAG: hypothetical protein WCO13_10370 [Bacteroidota bacterium]
MATEHKISTFIHTDRHPEQNDAITVGIKGLLNSKNTHSYVLRYVNEPNEIHSFVLNVVNEQNNIHSFVLNVVNEQNNIHSVIHNVVNETNGINSLVQGLYWQDIKYKTINKDTESKLRSFRTLHPIQI